MPGGIAQRFTRAFRPQINGKAERFIQSELRKWVYGRAYENSEQRPLALLSGATSTTGSVYIAASVRSHAQAQASRKNLMTLHT